MGMRIDKSRAHHLIFCIDNEVRLSARQMADGLNGISRYGDISKKPGRAGAVHNFSVLDQNVIHGPYLFMELMFLVQSRGGIEIGISLII